MPDVYHRVFLFENKNKIPQTENMPWYRITDTFSCNLPRDRRMYLLHLLKEP